MGEDWSLEQDIERARDGIDSFAGDGSTEREAFERVAVKARAAPDLLATLQRLVEFYGHRPAPIWDEVRAAIAKTKGSDIVAP